MQLPFREHHLLSLLNGYERQSLPLDLFISHYFKEHKALGSKDRGFIAENIYGMIRWQGLLEAHGAKSWEQKLKVFQTLDIDEELKREDLSLAEKLSFPEVLLNTILRSYSEKETIDLCLSSNQPAPTTVRANPLKISRDELLQRWSTQYEVSPCLISPLGIVFHKKINFFSLPEFKEGLFEVQDEGSQLVADLINCKPGDHVMDYCSGSGGKTLAFAHKTNGKGQIYLHDIRPRILIEATKRLNRAGIQNAQIAKENDPKLKKLKKKMDWVLVDAPCSGTGTLRRNPDMKWKFTNEMLERLVGEQRMIFEKALSYLAPNGTIVYATCSLLKDENEAQVEHFIKTYHLKVSGDPFKSLPAPGKMDGLFGVRLTR